MKSVGTVSSPGITDLVMHVNELAQHAGVEAHVVRYYTQIGLFHPLRDPDNRYREYSNADSRRLEFTRRARALGFSLGDVTSILSNADAGLVPCREVRELIQLRARENRARLSDLQQLQRRVEETVARWKDMPDQPPGHDGLCHLIESVSEFESELT